VQGDIQLKTPSFLEMEVQASFAKCEGKLQPTSSESQEQRVRTLTAAIRAEHDRL
jgi:hypothetical protein